MFPLKNIWPESINASNYLVDEVQVLRKKQAKLGRKRVSVMTFLLMLLKINL